MMWYLVLLIILSAVVAVMYNRLVSLRNRVRNSFSQIDVQLKRRYDLIPNLVNTVKGYAKHERETLESVIKARQQAIDASGVKDQAQAENFLSQTLKSLFAVVENYPNLKADRGFRELQEEITTTENRIAFARQFYNDSVLDLNNRVEMFPTNIIANIFSFKKEDMFELTLSREKEAPQVEF